MKIWGNEPVLVLAFLRALVVLVTAFGLSFTPEQVAAVYLVMELGLSLGAALQALFVFAVEHLGRIG